MKYTGIPNYPHDGSDRVGVLLVNHGSPDAPDARSLRPYLRSFLSDPRLIELPRWLWLPILNAFVLTTRPRRSARAYRSVWTAAGSPMSVLCQELQEALAERLTGAWGDRVRVALGMSYGRPSIASGLEGLRDAGCTKLLVLPLYPQYSGTTTGAVFDQVTRVLQGWRWVPEFRFVGQYADHPGYLDAVAASIEGHWRALGRSDRLLFSFHGIPQRYADAGDPYTCYCDATARRVAERLGLREEEFAISFQSRFGRGRWLEPATEDVAERWRAAGVATVDVVCPGFAVDCLETLEELGIGLAAQFATGGGQLRVVPCLNAGAAHVAALASLLEAQARGWEQALRSASHVPPLRRSGAGGVA